MYVRHALFTRSWLVATVLLAQVLGCGSNDTNSNDPSDASTDSDTDTDSDSDTDTDTGPDDCSEPCPGPCTFYVNNEVPQSGCGCEWSDSFATVQEGIDAARAEITANDDYTECQVWVAAGTYYIYSSDRGDTIEMKPHVHVYGGFSGDEISFEERDWETNVTILDGHESAASENQVFHVVTGVDDTTLDGFTVTGGYAFDGVEDEEFWGGGMLSYGGASTVANCRFIENVASRGGGIAIVDGSPSEITNCAFENNEGYLWGGGVFIDESIVEITDCTFTNNIAGNGGGVYSDGTPTISDSTFLGNEVVQSGGAIYLNIGSITTPMVDGCTLQNNHAGNQGGGLFCDGDAIIDRCFVLGNTAGWNAGGVCSTFSSLTLSRSVIADNSATGISGIVFFDSAVTIESSTIAQNFNDDLDSVVHCFNGELAVENSILWNEGVEELFNDGDCALSVSSCNIQGGWTGDGNFDSDPLFADPESDDYHFLPGSPCIDAADGSIAPELDLDGNPRVDDPATPNTGIGPPWADVGAFEYQP